MCSSDLIDPETITELDWWESVLVPRTELSLIATPAQHFSGRGIRDRNSTLWAGWVMDGPKHRLFYTGDTGLTPELSEIGRRFGPFDMTMIEIGAWHPAWGSIHLGPANALRAFEMLGGGTLLPVHWATFDLGLHPWDEPLETLVRLAPREMRLLTPPLGRAIEPAREDGITAWWRTAPRREPAASRRWLPAVSD